MSVRPDTRTGKYVVRWRAGGRHLSRSFTLRRDAEKFEREQKRIKELGCVFDPARGFETVSKGSRALVGGSRGPDPAGADPRRPGRIDVFRQSLESRGVGAATISKSLAVLSGVCRFAVLRGLLDANPVREVPKPRVRRGHLVIPVTPATVERIRVELLGRERVRDATLVSVLAYAGLRPGEALALRWSDLHRAFADCRARRREGLDQAHKE